MPRDSLYHCSWRHELAALVCQVRVVLLDNILHCNLLFGFQDTMLQGPHAAQPAELWGLTQHISSLLHSKRSSLQGPGAPQPSLLVVSLGGLPLHSKWPSLQGPGAARTVSAGGVLGQLHILALTSHVAMVLLVLLLLLLLLLVCHHAWAYPSNQLQSAQEGSLGLGFEWVY